MSDFSKFLVEAIPGFVSATGRIQEVEFLTVEKRALTGYNSYVELVNAKVSSILDGLYPVLITKNLDGFSRRKIDIMQKGTPLLFQSTGNSQDIEQIIERVNLARTGIWLLHQKLDSENPTVYVLPPQSEGFFNSTIRNE